MAPVAAPSCSTRNPVPHLRHHRPHLVSTPPVVPGSNPLTSPTTKSSHLSPTNNPSSLHKFPLGDGPYVRAKQVQLLEKDPDRAIAMYWAAINANDRVDSALKDMAIVMKQQNRPEEAIEAIKSFRNRCSDQAQESLDNVLLDLYKKCGRLNDQIELLKHKLTLIHKGMVFNGKRTKTARSQGRKFQISIRQEATRLLGNLGWAFMQQCNYIAAETVYRKALSIESDSNKLCNLGVCLVRQGRLEEARVVLERVSPVSPDGRVNSESHIKSYQRAQALLEEIRGSQLDQSNGNRCQDVIGHGRYPDNMQIIDSDYPSSDESNNSDSGGGGQQVFDLWSHWKLWEPPSLIDSHVIKADDNYRKGNHNARLIEGGYHQETYAHIVIKGDYHRDNHGSSTSSDADDDLHRAVQGLRSSQNDDDLQWISSNRTANDARLIVGQDKADDQAGSDSKGSKQSAAVVLSAEASMFQLPRISPSLSTNHDCGPPPLAVRRTQGGGSADDVDFTCVDRVIESIVPDAPSASQTVESMISTPASIMQNSTAAVSELLYDDVTVINHPDYRQDYRPELLHDDDDDDSDKRPSHPGNTPFELLTHLESIRQHRLRVFQSYPLYINQSTCGRGIESSPASMTTL